MFKKLLSKIFKTIGIISFVLLITLIALIVYKPELLIKKEAPIKQDVGSTLAKIFKNEYIYIKEDSKDTCFNYKNNLNYYQGEVITALKNSKEANTFLYYDINTGDTFSYKENTTMFTASTIKAALAIYIYDLASKGQTSLDKKLTYSPSYYGGGSGILRTKTIGSMFTVRTLIEYSVIESDNSAYLMLLNEYGYKNVQAFWLGQGTTTTYKASTKWGTMTATDGLIYMKYLYKFSKENKEYGAGLLKVFKQAKFRYVYAPILSDIEIAHKSGFTLESANDLSIIFTKNPYIITIFSKKNGLSSDRTFFVNITKKINAYHEYYWTNIGCKY